MLNQLHDALVIELRFNINLAAWHPLPPHSAEATGAKCDPDTKALAPPSIVIPMPTVWNEHDRMAPVDESRNETAHPRVLADA
mmetsp:Transcript_6233/g.9883  ORF Transcript_6233/g.9883 Transcript_6233/m.9883 type:complete len:83 (-) Transcript_6233:364-612(-)